MIKFGNKSIGKNKNQNFIKTKINYLFSQIKSLIFYQNKANQSS